MSAAGAHHGAVGLLGRAALRRGPSTGPGSWCRGWSAEERERLRAEVPKLALRAAVAGRSARHVARDVLDLARAGLKARTFADERAGTRPCTSRAARRDRGHRAHAGREAARALSRTLEESVLPALPASACSRPFEVRSDSVIPGEPQPPCHPRRRAAQTGIHSEHRTLGPFPSASLRPGMTRRRVHHPEDTPGRRLPRWAPPVLASVSIWRLQGGDRVDRSVAPAG